jgi:hypothetical protein
LAPHSESTTWLASGLFMNETFCTKGHLSISWCDYLSFKQEEIDRAILSIE